MRVAPRLESWLQFDDRGDHFIARTRHFDLSNGRAFDWSRLHWRACLLGDSSANERKCERRDDQQRFLEHWNSSRNGKLKSKRLVDTPNSAVNPSPSNQESAACGIGSTLILRSSNSEPRRSASGHEQPKSCVCNLVRCSPISRHW